MDKEKEINLKNSRDFKKPSFSKVDFGLWFLKNRRFFFIALIVLLFSLSVFLYSRFFYSLYDYIRYTPEERRLLEELVLIGPGAGPDRLAVPLAEGSVQSFFHNNKYDFVASIRNPNNNFFAHLNYCFFDGDEELACSSATIFPEENKYLIILAIDIDKRPSNLKFKVKSLKWERVDVRKYPNWKEYYSERSNFLISDIKFEIGRPSATLFATVNNLSFNIKNNSPYNYWELPLSILLFNRNSLVGINKYTIFEIMSLEERNISLNWSNSISSVDKVEIIPLLDVLNTNNYIPYK